MGRRGPPPMPDVMRKMRGRRHRKKEPGKPPTTLVGVPSLPDRLKRNPLMKHAWNQLVPQLKTMGVLEPQHGVMLEALVVMYARALIADEVIRREGMFLKRKRGVVVHPAVRVSVSAWRDVRTFAQEFGLTPAAATRVRASAPPPEPPKGKQSAEAFIFRDGGKVIGHVGQRDPKGA